MPVLKTAVDADFKKAFVAAAKAKGISESEMLRLAALAVVDPHGSYPEPVQPAPGRAELARMTVYMPGFIKDATKEFARVKGMNPGPFVAALLQTHLMHSPVLADRELAVLRTSNRELAAIGRNLNQVARALNESFYETDRIKLEMLKALNAVIAENRDSLRSLVRSSLKSWGVEHELD